MSSSPTLTSLRPVAISPYLVRQMVVTEHDGLRMARERFAKSSIRKSRHRQHIYRWMLVHVVHYVYIPHPIWSVSIPSYLCNSCLILNQPDPLQNVEIPRRSSKCLRCIEHHQAICSSRNCAPQPLLHHSRSSRGRIRIWIVNKTLFGVVGHHAQS